MASRQESLRPRPAPRLYLVTETVDDAGALARALSRAIAANDVAAVLLRLPDQDDEQRIAFAQTIAAPVQDGGVALLLDAGPDLVARSGADGAHFDSWRAFAAGAKKLQPARIAGAGGLQTRHDAMLAAEAGADYVMFGEPTGSGALPPFSAVIERVSWWSDVCEPPCVGYARHTADVAALVDAGADFIALGEHLWNDAQALASAADALREPGSSALEPV